MMKLTIGRCNECSRTRLVDVVNTINVCFACKQSGKGKSKVKVKVKI